MKQSLFWVALVLVCGCAPLVPGDTPAAAVSIDLVARFEEGRVRPVNRSVDPLAEAMDRGLRIDERDGYGVAWLDGLDVRTGNLEVLLRGRDLDGRSFVGLAFHGIDDETYDAVFLRPFNFRSADPERRQRSVQYVSHPEHPWHRLREDFPGVYENGISAAADPDGWVRLRISIAPPEIRVHVDDAAEPDLVVRQLGSGGGGRVGLWVGNRSGGDFATLSITGVPR